LLETKGLQGLLLEGSQLGKAELDTK